MTDQYTIYFAGDLFDHKHLVGNALLASAIDRVSEGKYRCVVPQDLEQATSRAVDIRNQDLKYLMECDLAIFNFDGTELDSGTVVEFMFAKMIDIPCVILRSDFRNSGDQAKDGDDWNLMASFYPRTQKLQFNAMEWYNDERDKSGMLSEVLDRYYYRIATALIEQLDIVLQEQSVLSGSDADLERIYDWALRFPGGGFSDLFAGTSAVRELVSKKRSKGLLS